MIIVLDECVKSILYEDDLYSIFIVLKYWTIFINVEWWLITAYNDHNNITIIIITETTLRIE